MKGILSLHFIFSRRYFFKNNGLKPPKGPVLFLSNHQLNLDAVRLRIVNNRRIVFVAHDEVYRNWFFRFVAHSLADTVCRSNSKNNISYLKELFQAKKQGLSIGIYPEGGIAYFNQSLPIDISIAKLAKKLDIPIMLCNVHGGSFVSPRWSRHKSRNKVIYSYEKLIDVDTLRQMSVNDLYNTIMQYISFNDYDWQRDKMLKIRRKHPCANLEHAFCVCPQCKEVNSLSFYNDKIICNNCNNTFSMDNYGFLTGADGIDDLVKWNNLQQDILTKYLSTPRSKILLHDTNLEYLTTPIGTYFKNSTKSTADITLYYDRIEIMSENNTSSIPIQDIVNVYVEFKNTLQIHTNSNRYRFTSNDLPAYVWVAHINALISNLSIKK